jgi:hypothetical protein
VIFETSTYVLHQHGSIIQDMIYFCIMGLHDTDISYRNKVRAFNLNQQNMTIKESKD